MVSPRPFPTPVPYLLFALCAAALPAQDAAIELEATWPKIDSSINKLHHKDEFQKLFQPGPAVAKKAYEWQAFASLLPDADTEVGAVWELDSDALVAFLKQLHPGASSRLHMGSQTEGAYAVLLERSPERVDVLLRLHSEFELERRRTYFTWSQFEGRLVADPSKQKVLGFRLGVPERNNNYDVHVRMEDRNGFHMDMGLVKNVGLRGGTLKPHPDLAAARRSLREAFYPFGKLDWLPFAQALKQAKQDGKPLHVITIFGPLDDESC